MMFSIFGREVKSYFLSPVAYVVTASFVLFASASFYYRAVAFPGMLGSAASSGFLDVLKQNRINYFVLSPMLNDVVFILMFLIPVMTMRLWSEEKRASTDELLLTSPISVSRIIIGKYLAGLLFVSVLLLLTFIHVGFLFYYASPDPGVTFASYAGLFLFIATAVAVGLFTSTLTANPIIASVVCLIIELILTTLYGVGYSIKSPDLGRAISYISWKYHMLDMSDGIIGSGDLIYFAGMIFIWLFLAYQSVESSRWR